MLVRGEHAAIKKYEPNINTKNLLGATYYLQGQVDPFKFMYVFADMGVRSFTITEAYPP